MKRNAQMSSFVAPSAPVVVEPKPEPTQQGVSAQVAGNAAGGIGAVAIGLSVWVIGWGVLHGAGIVADAWPDPAQVAVSSVTFGLLTFGVLMFIRNSMDEARDAWDRASAQQYISELENSVTLHKKRIADLSQELGIAQTNLSVAELKASGAGSETFVRPIKELGQDWADAEAMIRQKWSGRSWARDAMRAQNIGDTRWKAAMSVLQRCGIATRDGDGPWEPWDKNATLEHALHSLEVQKAETLRILQASAKASVARGSGDATTHSEATR